MLKPALTIRKDNQVTGNYYHFTSAGYAFTVYHSTRAGYFTVYREKRGRQLRPMGKTFWRAVDMIAHYKTAAMHLAMIAADARTTAPTERTTR